MFQQRFILRVAQKSDYETVLQFLGRHLNPKQEIQMKSIASGASVLAFTDNEKQLIGVSLAEGLREKDCIEKLKWLSRIPKHTRDLEKKIFTEEIRIRSQIWRLFDVEEALCLSAVRVHQDFQGYSLIKSLLQSNLDYAAKLGFSVAFGLSFANEEFKITESLDFHPIYSVKCVDYQDYKGRSPFKGFSSEDTAEIVFKSLFFHRLYSKN